MGVGKSGSCSACGKGLMTCQARQLFNIAHEIAFREGERLKLGVSITTAPILTHSNA
jgi:hypothetical protein